MTTAARWEKVISDPELLKKAVEAKWISPDGQTTLCLQWDNVKKAHMPALGGNQVPSKEVNTLLMELVTIAKLPLVGGQQISCNPSSFRGVQLACPCDVDRGGRSHGCGEQGMANPGQAGLHVGLDFQRDVSAARAPTEEPTGQSCFRLSSADVLALRLGNSNNFCYMNSVTICLLWVCAKFPDQVMIPPMVCKLLQGAARSGQVFHVWHSFTLTES